VTTQLNSQEREDALWLGRVQARAILPVKWALLLVCLAFWLWPRGWALPPPEVFTLFFLYASMLCAETYFIVLDRVSAHQMRPLALTSYVVDLAFITVLTAYDWVHAASRETGREGSEFGTFFVLMALRGFALLRTRREAVTAALTITVLYIGSAMMQIRNADFLMIPTLAFRLALIWTVIFLSMIIVDVLHRQREEMLRTRERLVRAQSLAQIGELAAGVAHEINNPISVISTYCEYIRRLPDQPLADDIAAIHAEAKRCEGIVKQLLDFSNPRVGTFERIDIVPLIRELRDFLALDKNSNVELSLEGASGLGPVQGDATQLKQAFMNCIVNARQALTEAASESPRVEINVAADTTRKHAICVTIADNGPGISEEDVARAFDPFFTKRTSGTGLGLSISHRIMAAHEGQISISRRPSGGTIVTIILPMARNET
jgi:signal transduction histidine kinase